MKNFIFLSVSCILSLNIYAQQLDLIKLSKSLSADNIKTDVYKLSSEEMQGRETGEIGQKRAAKYIYNQFKDAGLLSYHLTQDSLSYFQNFDIYKKTPPKISLSINGTELEPYEDFSISGYSDLNKENIEMVFLGTAPDSLFMGKDFSDKAVLFITSNLYAGPSKALDIIKFTKSKIVFYCNPTNPHQIETIIQRQKKMISRRQSLDPVRFPTKNPFDSITHKKMYENVERAKNTYQGPISEKIVAKILKVKLKDLKKAVSGSPLKIKNKEQITMNINLTNNYKTQLTENVIACIPGIDRKEEVIVVSAHYDHIGMNGKRIYFGANDNASGTAALLEIARKLKKAVEAGLPLKRSVVFATFTGEEKGLLGSKYFVETSTIPHKNIKANLNIDMLGRKDSKHDHGDFVYLLGTNDLNPKFKTITDSINELHPKLELDYSFEKTGSFLYAASDQASFVDRNIPAIFYFNGLHNDYHKTTDTPDKIDYDSIKKVSSLIFLTLVEIANQE